MAGTGNPVPSDAIADLKANADTLDQFVSSDAESAVTRTNKTIKTIKGIEQDANDAISKTGWFPVIGSFEDGGTITERNQVLLLQNADGSNGAGYYSWGGTLPKDVPASSAPSTTGGIGETAWVYRADATVRSDAANGTLDIAGESASFLRKVAQAQNGNTDLLDRLKKSVNFRGMSFIRNGASDFLVVMGWTFENYTNAWVSEYRFATDDDGFISFRGGITGTEDTATTYLEPTLDGSGFNLGSPPNSYTTTVGDKLTGSFAGSYFAFKSLKEDRGGLWKVTLSTGEVGYVSTWSASLKTEETVVFDGLEHKQRDFEMEFMGKDPLGTYITTAYRGWFFYQADNQDRQPIRIRKVGSVSTGNKRPISLSSIMDFAIKAKPSGAAYGTEWVPQHGSVNGVLGSVFGRIYVDNVRVFESGLLDIPTEQSYIDCERITLSQRMPALNPNGADGTMWDHNIVHSFSAKDMSLKIMNGLRFAQDTRVDTGYFAMLAMDSGEGIDQFVLSNGEKIDALKNDRTVDIGYDVTSAVGKGLHSAGRGHAAGIKVSSMREASGLGEAWEPSVSPVLISDRSSEIFKIYWQFADGETFSSGQRLSCTHEYCFISGALEPDSDLDVLG